MLSSNFSPSPGDKVGFFQVPFFSHSKHNPQFFRIQPILRSCWMRLCAIISNFNWIIRGELEPAFSKSSQWSRLSATFRRLLGVIVRFAISPCNVTGFPAVTTSTTPYCFSSLVLSSLVSFVPLPATETWHLISFMFALYPHGWLKPVKKEQRRRVNSRLASTRQFFNKSPPLYSPYWASPGENCFLTWVLFSSSYLPSILDIGCALVERFISRVEELNKGIRHAVLDSFLKFSSPGSRFSLLDSDSLLPLWKWTLYLLSRERECEEKSGRFRFTWCMWISDTLANGSKDLRCFWRYRGMFGGEIDRAKKGKVSETISEKSTSQRRDKTRVLFLK